MKTHAKVAVLAVLLAGSASAENPTLIPAPRDFPTNWMARHAANVDDAKKGGADILFLGDSITDGWHWDKGGKEIWEKDFAPRHAANFGIGYDRVQNVLWRIENGELEGISPRVVVLLIGTNNTGSDSTPEIIEGISNLVQRIGFHLPKAKVILFGIFPRGEKNDPARGQIKAINTGLSHLAGGNLVFLDIGEKFLTADGTLPRSMFPDLLHPNEAGYQIWAGAINASLDPLLK